MILNAQHPDLKLETVFTIRWNIWKARNDILFNKKKMEQYASHPCHRGLLIAGLMRGKTKKIKILMTTPVALQVQFCLS